MANQDSRDNHNRGNFKPNTHQSIIVAKGDGFIVAFVVMFCFFVTLSLVGAYHIGQLTEKVSTLEDIVFNQEYKIERVKK